MPNCIAKDTKSLFSTMIEQKLGHDLLGAFVAVLPACEDVMKVEVPAAVAEAREKRALPEIWGIEPEYVDETGKRTKKSSPSALAKELGLPMSGIQCDAEGKKCKAQSVVDIFRIHGYIVSGNGEPKKAAEGGRKFVVYHPSAPGIPEEVKGA
jgi:hypothetical protein